MFFDFGTYLKSSYGCCLLPLRLCLPFLEPLSPELCFSVVLPSSTMTSLDSAAFPLALLALKCSSFWSFSETALILVYTATSPFLGKLPVRTVIFSSLGSASSVEFYASLGLSAVSVSLVRRCSLKILHLIWSGTENKGLFSGGSNGMA